MNGGAWKEIKNRKRFPRAQWGPVNDATISLLSFLTLEMLVARSCVPLLIIVISYSMIQQRAHQLLPKGTRLRKRTKEKGSQNGKTIHGYQIPASEAFLIQYMQMFFQICNEHCVFGQTAAAIALSK
jgi:hypothetical protein